MWVKWRDRGWMGFKVEYICGCGRISIFLSSSKKGSFSRISHFKSKTPSALVILNWKMLNENHNNNYSWGVQKGFFWISRNLFTATVRTFIVTIMITFTNSYYECWYLLDILSGVLEGCIKLTFLWIFRIYVDRYR